MITEILRGEASSMAIGSPVAREFDKNEKSEMKQDEGFMGFDIKDDKGK